MVEEMSGECGARNDDAGALAQDIFGITTPNERFGHSLLTPSLSLQAPAGRHRYTRLVWLRLAVIGGDGGGGGRQYSGGF